MKYLIVAIIGLFFSANVYALEGTIITTKMDTLKGKISFAFGNQYNNDGISIKVGKKKKRFVAYEVKEVVSEDGDIYHPIKMDGRYQFIQLLKDGSYLKLYGYNSDDYKNYDFGFQMLVKADGGQHKLGNIGYKKRLLNFLTACPEVTEGISDGKMKKGDIEKVVDAYNTCIEVESQKEEEVLGALKEASKIEDLIATVEGLEMDSKQELIQMLIDVKDKLKDQKEVPSYLKGAIIEKLGDRQELVNLFNEIVSSTEE
ncbi:MAG: hypothetical protein OCD76_20055 [Reichenbachiella sp.]